ncbi:MAG: LuxR C-terminal-related transcriptional regulator [Actinomycetes bacterium]
MTGRKTSGYESSAALFIFDRDLEVILWNPGAEALTGIAAEDAVGRQCWEVIGGEDDEGAMVCHAGCSRARQLREGRSVPKDEFFARTATGRSRLSFETISAHSESGPRFLHLMREAPCKEVAPVAEARLGPPPNLTPRQREILGLIGGGQPVKVVAARLGLMETTVRNHVRLLLVALGAHSQLEAVARARSFGLI